jgi:competence protein ComEC
VAPGVAATCIEQGVAAIGLLPALSVLIGATLGLITSFTAWTYAAALPLTCAGALAGWWRRSPRVTLVAVVAGFLAGGAALSVNARERALHSSIRHILDREFGGFEIETIGPAGRHDPLPSRIVLVDDASPRDGFVSLRAEVIAVELHGAWQPTEGGLAVSVNGTVAEDRVEQWRAGRMIEVPITFRRPQRYLNDGVPDFERDQALDGVTLLGTVKSGLLLEVVRPGGFVSERCADVREHVRSAVRRWIEVHDSISAAIATAVLIGDRTGLPDDTREALQHAGTYHVIAISGGNIAILATAVTIVLMIVGVRGRGAACVAIAVLSAYALIVTAGPSVWRATLMAVLYFAARALDHRSGGWQTASVAAALMVVVRPLDVRDGGFILTFGATLALFEGARIGTRLAPRVGILSWIVASVFASLAIEIALLPVSALLFSRVTGAGLVLNLIAVPLMGVVQIGALVTAFANGVPAIAGPAGLLAHLAAQGLIGSASLVNLAPWSTARVPPPAALVVVSYYAAIAAMFLWKGRAPRAIAVLVWVASALVVTGFAPRLVREARPNETLRVTMFDVGQGESILLAAPSGRQMLIDTGGAPFGGSFGIGARVLAPALWARGVGGLDALLLTHGDPDHVGGALDVLADFVPRHLWTGIDVPTHRPTADIRAAAARLAIPAGYRRLGDIETDGGMRLRVLHPPPPEWERRRVRNDDSVVIEVVYGDVAVLLTGDISADVEREILPRLTRAATRILKVAHHGSRTSTSQALLSEWRPQYALISAGRGNTFGHPAPEVLQRLHEIGATVLRTDLHGQITLETDGRRVEFTTFEAARKGAE